MDEYINKTKFEELMRKKARSNFDLYYADRSKHYHDKAIGYSIAADEAHDFPSADVHPVKWISVKDGLPEPEKDVLVWYRYTWGAGFTSYRFGISRWYSNIKRWYEGCLPKDIDVLYWQPLPEPPKDGEQNDN